MGNFCDIDFSLDFVSKALKEKDLNACRVRVALMNSPEKIKLLLRQAIEVDEETVFCFFVENKFLDLVKSEKDYAYNNVWEELIARGKFKMIEKVLNYPKRIMSMENLTDLNRALLNDRCSPIKDREKYLGKVALIKKIHSLESKMMASSCYAFDVLELNDGLEGEGDFLPLMITAFGHRAYRFDELKKEKIELKGFKNYLFDILEKHMKEAEKSAVSNSEKDKWISDVFENNKDFKNEPLSVSETNEIRRQIEEDKTGFYKKEFEKTQKFYELYSAFCASPNAPLAKLFEGQNQTIVLFKDVGQSTRGQRLEDFIVLAELSLPVLHHELIHNVDENGILSQTPFFKKMYSYVEGKMKEAQFDSLFGGKNFWCLMVNASYGYTKEAFSREMLPFFASFSYANSNIPQPAFVKTALAVVNRYADACVKEDEKEKNRIIQALQQTDMPSTVKGFDKHLHSILMPVRAKHCLQNQVRNLQKEMV